MQQSSGDPFVLIVAACLTFLIALSVSRVAGDAKFLPDSPNHRSSHKRITSKAGGAAIASAWLVGMLIISAFWANGADAILGARLLALAALAFLLGLVDDLWGLAAPLKLLAQLLIAILFVFVFGPIEEIAAPMVGDISLGFFGPAITVLWIVGFMNVFNFMDGADGLAAGSAILGLGVFSVAVAIAGATFLSIALILLAIGAFGFFPRNFDHSKIFMGDCGSQTLSFLIAALAVIALEQAALSILFVPTVFLPLIFDVAFTLAHRSRRGKNIMQAHREHLYQLAMGLGRSHREIAIVYLSLTGVSSTVALVMLTLAPEAQWLAPTGLAVAFLIGALAIYRKAKAAELLG